jgi:two-component system, sensor histidine kinase and response regulator
MENNNHSPSILIVDDNPQNLQVLGRLLQEKLYEIEFATNGVAALDWLNSRQFDLVLLDINMPEMDGFEVCRRIRKNDSLANLPVIFLSADNDRESILKGFEFGGQDYVTKPFDSRELIVRVKTQITLKESLENLEKLNRSLEEKVKERTIQLKEANEHLETMNKELTELDDAKAEFLNLISHEIRTPLNGMILPVEMLKDTGSSSETKELIDILDSSVKRLEKFALNALLITRLKTKPNEISRKEMDLADVLRETIEEEKTHSETRKITLETSMQKFPGRITGDRELIKKCLLNILDNAIVFSPEGSRVHIKLYNEGESPVIEVSDNGPGLPAEILSKGPEPFTRGKDYNDMSTGIGLPMAKLIMVAHGGEISLSNKKDKGAVVKLKF